MTIPDTINKSGQRLKLKEPMGRILFNDTLNHNSMKKLRSKVVKALKREFTFECTISARMNQVILNVKNIVFEEHLGQVIQQTQLIIDKYFPKREEHLCLVVREIGGNHQNTFKIWKSI